MDRTPDEKQIAQVAEEARELEPMWASYREACPDPEPSANFMPALWARIETHRAARISAFRRWTQIWVTAAVALALLLMAIRPATTPNPDRDAFYSGTYVDVLVADHATNYAQVLPVGDFQ